MQYRRSSLCLFRRDIIRYKSPGYANAIAIEIWKSRDIISHLNLIALLLLLLLPFRLSSGDSIAFINFYCSAAAKITVPTVLSRIPPARPEESIVAILRHVILDAVVIADTKRASKSTAAEADDRKLARAQKDPTSENPAKTETGTDNDDDDDNDDNDDDRRTWQRHDDTNDTRSRGLRARLHLCMFHAHI